jgi:hypothetical protein
MSMSLPNSGGPTRSSGRSGPLDNPTVIASTLEAFRQMSADAQLVFLSLPTPQNLASTCVGYAFVAVDTDLHIAMRRKNATWNRHEPTGQIPFAVGAANADQVCGVADWQASVLSEQDAAWASQAWDLLGKKYPWFKASHLDGDPVIVKLKPRTFSLLRYDERSDRLWRTTISLDDDAWSVHEHAAKDQAPNS